MRMIVLFSLIIVSVLVVLRETGGHASADIEVPGDFDVAVDTDTTGNTDTSIGSLQPCTSVSVGDTFNIDIVVHGVGAPGIAAFGMDILYDPAVVAIDSHDPSFILDIPDSTLVDFTAGDPGSTGDFRTDVVALTNTPNYNLGDGVMERLTLHAVGAGDTAITLTDNFDETPDHKPLVISYDFNQNAVAVFTNLGFRDGEVAVGQPCSGTLTDSDTDGWVDGVEDYAGTAAARRCAVTPAANDEPGTDAWPLDFNDDARANVLDVSTYSSVFNSTAGDARYANRADINADTHINVLDVSQYSSAFGDVCTP
jgi:hypothetical protein